MADLEIFLFILGDSPASTDMFLVTAHGDTSVGKWKGLVHAQGPTTLNRCKPADLTLWKLHEPITSEEGDDRVAALAVDQNLSQAATKMIPAKKLSYYFPSTPKEDSVHVIVVPSLPLAGERHDRPSEDDADVNRIVWSQRQDTVAGISELLHKYHLVQVRGTPASGKTTLMHLLHAHIVREHPNAEVFIRNDWPVAIMGRGENTERLAEHLPGYPSYEDGERYFLFDEGHTTYWDTTLWKAFKDSIQYSEKSVYCILFCSYGNEDVSDAGVPTPVFFGDARVTLDRTNRGLSKPCGLLLDKEEFYDVISRRPKLRLTNDLRDFIYDFTRGHVGATIAVIDFLLKKRESSMLTGVDYCLEAFHQDTLSHDEFCKHLSMDRGLGRGMPREPAKYAPTMRALLLYGSIDPGPEEPINPEAKIESVSDAMRSIRLRLRECYKHGFVDINEAKQYTFASPLHQQLWSWLLVPQPDYQFPFQDLFSFVKDTVSKFRPSQLGVSGRRVGSASHRPPEAQYQEEYYRCAHALTNGNVQLSPEYAAAAGSRPGRIDFFIPLKKWGIELTREGDRLEEHDSRFAEDGAYGQWLQSSDMEDYVLLDFRSTMPMRAYPGVNKLYRGFQQ